MGKFWKKGASDLKSGGVVGGFRRFRRRWTCKKAAPEGARLVIIGNNVKARHHFRRRQAQELQLVPLPAAPAAETGADGGQAERIHKNLYIKKFI